MEKLKSHTPNLVSQNIGKIAELFPACVTEARDEQGNLTLAIDFDQLRQELSGHIVEGPSERYHLDWPGKREAILAANAPIAKTLRPCREESVDFDTTQNIFIEGDNLDALKLLQETYLGKVKVIYIDPPYNTGNDFLYDDDFTADKSTYLELSNQSDNVGNRLVLNTEANGRFHSDWLTMLYPRLKAAWNLLASNGLIFISIDDNEISNLRRLCDEIFGAGSFMVTFVWRRRQVADSRNEDKASPDHEYVVCYKKPQAVLKGVPIDENKYSNPDNDDRGPWFSDNLTGLANKKERPNLHYDLVNPATGRSYPASPTRGWGYGQDAMARLIEEGRILWPNKIDGRPRLKKFLREAKNLCTGVSSWLSEVGTTTEGTRTIQEIFGTKTFPFAKPLSLLTEIISQATADRDGIILDFFAGSGTTAHATMQLNATDRGCRRFILVQLPEPAELEEYPTIADITKERIRRAGRQIRSRTSTTAPDLDAGFRVLKIDTSSFKDLHFTPDEARQRDLITQIDNLKSDRSAEDLLFQVLVDWGIDLALPILRETIAGSTVFFVDDNALAACFDHDINEEVVKSITKRNPLRAVFRDRSYTSDSVKINIEQIFKLLAPFTEVRSL